MASYPALSCSAAAVLAHYKKKAGIGDEATSELVSLASQYEALRAAVQRNDITENRINQSVMRILLLKER